MMLVRRILQMIVISVLMMLIVIGNFAFFAPNSADASVSGPMGEWEIQVIDKEVADSSQALPLADIAVDKEGYPHISYYDDQNYVLKYAYMDSEGWHIEIVDAPIDDREYVGLANSIVIDSNDAPHITYMYWKYEEQGVRYAKRVGAEWKIEDIDLVSDDFYFPVGVSYTAVALDSQNTPHIVYLKKNFSEFNRELLQHAYLSNRVWVFETIDEMLLAFGAYVDGPPSLLIDDNDTLHVSYRHSGSSDIRYAIHTGSQWITETVVSKPHSIYSVLSLDSFDNPHMTFVEAPTLLKRATRTGQGWEVQDVAQGGLLSGNASFMDAKNQLHILYGIESKNGVGLIYLQPHTAGWEPIVVDNTRNAGTAVVMVIDDTNTIHAAYFEAASLEVASGDLKYTRCEQCAGVILQPPKKVYLPLIIE